MERKDCSVVIPVYKSAEVITLLVEMLGKVLSETSDNFEVILVNDGSPDNSWEVINQLADQYPWVVGISLMRNYGQHNALLCGIRQARFEVIVTMDDDLQNPPEEIPILLAELDRGFDVVYGVPENEQHGLFRDLASQMTKLMLKKTMGIQIARDVSAFRAFRTDVRKGFGKYSAPWVVIDVMLTWGASRFSSVKVQHQQRTVGVSSYKFRTLVSHALNMITGFSTLPLRFASLLGFFFTLFGVGIFIYVIGRYLIQGGSVPGFSFTASVIAIFSGVQLLTLGIMGEYLARMYVRLMNKPNYIIRYLSKNKPF